MKTLLAFSIATTVAVCAASCTTDDDAGELIDAASSPSPDAATPSPDGPVVVDDAGASTPDASAGLMDAATPVLDGGSFLTDASTSADAGDADAAIEDAAVVAADGSTASDASSAQSKTVIDVGDVAENPDDYEWFDFRPNLLKLILSGAAETEHIAILWYTVEDGSVGLHYHGQTESVYAIDGTQTDAKGVYPTGTVYFNPPGSGHEISDSSGFFILAYASPPDFASTDLIEEYTPIRIETNAPDFTSTLPFEASGTGMNTYVVPLAEEGGMSAQFMEFAAPAEEYAYVGNYVLVLEGSCEVDGATHGKGALAVTKDVVPEAFIVTASEDSTCLTMGISF